MPKPIEHQARRVVPWIVALLAAIPIACTDDISAGGAFAVDAGDEGGYVFVPPSARDAAVVDQTAPPMATCVSTECPAPYATCEQAGSVLEIPFRCENNLLEDRNNCGACGNACPESWSFPGLNLVSQCVDGACKEQCTEGFRDCNGLADDGCEANTKFDADNCGACGRACPTPTGGGPRQCIDGQCAGCESPKSWCGDFQGCVDLTSDPSNCGACGNACSPPPDAEPPRDHMQYSCANGECGKLVCEYGWANCNGDLSDGCEANTYAAFPYDTDNCGACGIVCASGQVCLDRPERGGDRPVCGCEPNTNEVLCGSYCADLLSDIANCGGCQQTCFPGTNQGSSCHQGVCERECLPGWGDCDGNSANGCETNLLVDGRHCGSCGGQCDTQAGQPCINGQCLTVECDAGTGPTK